MQHAFEFQPRKRNYTSISFMYMYMLSEFPTIYLFLRRNCKIFCSNWNFLKSIFFSDNMNTFYSDLYLHVYFNHQTKIPVDHVYTF